MSKESPTYCELLGLWIDENMPEFHLWEDAIDCRACNTLEITGFRVSDELKCLISKYGHVTIADPMFFERLREVLEAHRRTIYHERQVLFDLTR